MSDGIAPAIDKVGEPDPKAPEAEAGAPTIPTAAPVSEDTKPAEKKAEDLAARFASKVPKPVEVMSVPETPVNNGTPAGGTPRPELRIDEEEPKEKPVEEAQVILGRMDEESKDETSKSDEPTQTSTNGASEDIEIKDAPVSEGTSEASSAEKRKLDDEPAAPATNGNASKGESKQKNGSDERAEKKARVEDVPEDVPEPVAAAPATNGKNGKVKREKKVVAPAGRTARKTRSQGPVEV